MENNNSKLLLFFLAVAIAVVIWRQHSSITTLKIQNDYLVSNLDDYRVALNEANDRIDEANEMIENAKGYTWESYDDMGTALDDIDTVSTVDEP